MVFCHWTILNSMIARSKEYYWHWKVCFLLDLHYDIENGRIPNTNRYDKLSIHQQQYSSRTSVCSLYFTTRTYYEHAEGQTGVKHGAFVCLYIKITSKCYQEWINGHFIKRIINPYRIRNGHNSIKSIQLNSKACAIQIQIHISL